MASISSLGVGSGLDLASIVSGLVNAERAPTESRLNFREETATTRLSAFGALKSSLSLFQGSLSSLQISNSYNSKDITLSDESFFSATVNSSAIAGNYSVEVSALAKPHSLATDATTAFTDVNDTIGTGTLTIKFGTTGTGPYSFAQDTTKATQSITVSAANNNTTLSGLRDYINENDYGVQASIVNDGNGFRLTLTSEQTGAKNSMEITVSGDGDGNNNDNAGLSQLAFNASAQVSMGQTVAAQDAALKINGLDITRESNTVSGAVNGVTLNLLKVGTGTPVSVNVSKTTDGIKSSIEEFIASYNGLTGAINTLTRFDPDTNSAGLLIGDFTVRSISSQIRALVSRSVTELSGDVRSMSDIGVSTNSDGTLSLDTTKLDNALSNFPDEVEALFSLQGRPTDSDMVYSRATNDTQPGNYAVNVTTLATKAVFNGNAVNSLVIGAANDGFTIKVNGTLSNGISLTQGTYADGDALAAHIQAQINDDTNLKAAGASVTVSYDSINNKFDLTSSRYGSGSTIEFTALDTNTANDLGFTVSGGIDGVDVAGTINGITATGNGQLLTSAAGNSKGLALSITAGLTGNRGTVSFSRGIASTVDDLLDNFLNSGGFIDSREDGLNDELDEISDERVKLDQRINSLEARLISQFSALDALISQFNNTSSFLTQQLANLPEPNSIGNNN